MTKKEFNQLMEVRSFDDVLGYLCEHDDNIISKEELVNRIVDNVTDGNILTATQQLGELHADVNYYRINENKEVKPVIGCCDIEDLLEEDVPEMTLENIIQFIEKENITVGQLFSYDNILDYVKYELAPDIDELFDDSDITNYVMNTYAIEDVYDISTIIDWVKENRSVKDMVYLEWD